MFMVVMFIKSLVVGKEENLVCCDYSMGFCIVVRLSELRF